MCPRRKVRAPLHAAACHAGLLTCTWLGPTGRKRPRTLKARAGEAGWPKPRQACALLQTGRAPRQQTGRNCSGESQGLKGAEAAVPPAGSEHPPCAPRRGRRRGALGRSTRSPPQVRPAAAGVEALSTPALSTEGAARSAGSIHGLGPPYTACTSQLKCPGRRTQTAELVKERAPAPCQPVCRRPRQSS